MNKPFRWYVRHPGIHMKILGTAIYAMDHSWIMFPLIVVFCLAVVWLTL